MQKDVTNAFTLIELIVVIMLCVMLAVITIPAVIKIKQRQNAEATPAPIGVVFNNDAMFNKENRFKPQTVDNTQSSGGSIHFCPRCGYDLYSTPTKN